MILLSLLILPSFSLANIWPEKPVDLSTPVGVHLAISSPNSINVGWASYAKPEGQVCVSYGAAEKNLSHIACSNNSITYGTSRVWYNRVELTNLEPSKFYFYQINATNTTTYNFTMSRAPGDKTPYSFAALADLGYHSTEGTPRVDKHDTVHRWINMSNEYDFTFFPGDYAYADNFLDNANDYADFFKGEDAYEGLLERFHDLISPLTSSQPFMITAGNHEAVCADFKHGIKICPPSQTNFTDIRYRYNGMFPTAFNSLSNDSIAVQNRTKAQKLAVPPFWYSFDSGLVHFVFINTETDFEGAPDVIGASRGLNGGPFGYEGQQLEWLEADLASVDRSITPWVIVGGHRPWYTYLASENRCQSCMKAFEETLYHYGVDLVIMGHVHNSQRFSPIYNDKLDPNGYNDPKAPMYIIVGGAGNIEGLNPVTSLSWVPGLEWADGDNFAFAVVDVKNSTDLGIRFINSVNGTAVDSSALHKLHSESFVRQ